MHRREFLKLLGKGAAGVALGLCAVEMGWRAERPYILLTKPTTAAELKNAWYAMMDWEPRTIVNGEIGTYEGFRMIGGQDA